MSGFAAGPLETIRLDAGLETALRSGHPWIYRDRLPWHRLTGGELVRVEAGRAAAFGLYDAAGAIGVRLFTWDAPPDRSFLPDTVGRAVASRDPLRDAGHSAYRLIHGEGDGLPAVVADRYGRFAVLQPHAESVRQLLTPVARLVLREARLKGVVVRTDDSLQVLAGDAPPPEETVVENGLRFVANLREGQKTGMFLDHREHRATVRDLAQGLRVLDLFCYAGGFSVNALAGGAREVWSVDAAAPALRDATRNVALNDLPSGRHRTIEADVFAVLEQLFEAGERFDLVILDPPSLARAKRQRARAESAYRHLNAGAARLTVAGGLLATASCTAQIAPSAFEKVVRAGLASAGRSGNIVVRGGQPPDHPVPSSFPEGRYLKFLTVRLDP